MKNKSIKLASVIEKEVYENINQLLCLARLELSTVDLEKKEITIAKISEARILLAKAITDLRKLVKKIKMYA